MRKKLEDEIVSMLAQHVSAETLETVKMKITMILNDYNVDQEERALAVYEADETAMMLQKFLAAKIARGCTPRTIGYYKDMISKSLMKIGKPYDQVTADDVRYLLAMRVQRDGVSKVTANGERRALSSFYQWLQSEEILLRNPMTKVEAIKEKKTKKTAFSKMEIEQIREACRTPREEAMVEVLFSTWARLSEVVQIRLDDIAGENITVHGKGEKDRTVYLTPRAKLKVEKYLEERSDDNPYLFPRAKYAGDVAAMTKGKSRRKSPEWYREKSNVDETRHMDQCSLEGVIRNIGKRAGVKKTHPHRFRRTGATMALRSGMPLLQVSKMLGHEQIGTTQIYLDISDTELMQAHEKYVT